MKILLVRDHEEVRYLTGEERRRQPVVLVDPDDVPQDCHPPCPTGEPNPKKKGAFHYDFARGFAGRYVPHGWRHDAGKGWVPDQGQAERLRQLEAADDGALDELELGDLKPRPEPEDEPEPIVA